MHQGMSSDMDAPKPKPAPAAPLSIPQKRALEDSHSPAVSSPLNAELSALEPQPPPPPQPDDAAQAGRSKPARLKKESLKKREATGADNRHGTPAPAPAAEPSLTEVGPLRYKLAPPKLSDFDLPRAPILSLHHEVPLADGQEPVEVFETSEHVFNKKNFRYTHCIADPLFPSILYYRQTEPEPFGPRLSLEDAATHVYFDKSARHATTDKGFRMAKANTVVREGQWYWECKVTQGVRPTNRDQRALQGGKHVRIGWARREASLDAPVGFDAYSYGIRDVTGEKVHMSRPKAFFPPDQGIQEGDIIGLEIQLPSLRLHRKVVSGAYNPAVDMAGDESWESTEALNIVRDRVPIRFRAHTYFEKIEYHTTRELEDLMNPAPSGPGSSLPESPNPNHSCPALRTLPHSCIRIYKNGQLMGKPFENLLAFLPPASRPMPQVGAREGLDDGMLGYYPAVSLFRGGAVEVNFGPNFWFPPPDYHQATDGTHQAGDLDQAPLRSMAHRHKEQIAEDVVYDVIDEVDFWMQDGGGARGQNGTPAGNDAAALGAGREEIKELIQDD